MIRPKYKYEPKLSISVAESSLYTHICYIPAINLSPCPVRTCALPLYIVVHSISGWGVRWDLTQSKTIIASGYTDMHDELFTSSHSTCVITDTIVMPLVIVL